MKKKLQKREIENNLEIEVKKHEEIDVENKCENKYVNIDNANERKDEKKVKNYENDERKITNKEASRNTRNTTKSDKQTQRKLTVWLKNENNDTKKVVQCDKEIENEKK